MASMQDELMKSITLIQPRLSLQHEFYHTDNFASAGVIRNNGGVLASQGPAKKFPRPISRYWIKL